MRSVLPRPLPPVAVAVTDHAVERFRQRVGSLGELDVRPAIVARVARAWLEGRASLQAPDGAAGQRGSVYVGDDQLRDLVYVCRWDRPRGELVVVTLWETGQKAQPRVPRRFTDALGDRPRGRRLSS